MVRREDILAWLRERDAGRLDGLWKEADRVRRERVGDDVHLRGLIELSNHCVRSCAYCGLASWEKTLPRYRMTSEEIMAAAHAAESFGCGTVVLQAGEDYGIRAAWMAEAIRRLKAETPLAVTLSLGERAPEELAAWRAAGADRYLLRFETTNRRLYDAIHPPFGDRLSDRLGLLRVLRDLGYEVGGGVMIGLPGQSFEGLANDILAFAALDLDMIGVGPYIPNPGSPLETGAVETPDVADEQVPNDELTAYKVVALTRLVCPDANVPSTTALATLNNADGRELGLMRGANVVMPNATPLKYRTLYRIYPAKACLFEEPESFARLLAGRIERMGRRVGKGPGPSLNYLSRRSSAAPERSERCVPCPT